MKRKILIIEDDIQIQELIKERLLRELPDLELESLTDGISASQQIEYNAYDLIVTDMNLPRKDGASILKRVRHSQLNANTPIVVITGAPDFDMRKEFAPLFLFAKPFRSKELAQAITDLLSLGSLAKQRPFALFPELLVASDRLLKSMATEKLEISQPQKRSAGQLADADLFGLISMEFSGQKHRFVLSCSEEFFSQVFAKHSGGKSLPEDCEARKVLIEEFLKQWKTAVWQQFERAGQSLDRLELIEVFAGKESVGLKPLLQSPGLAVELESAVGSLRIEQLLDPYKGLLAA